MTHSHHPAGPLGLSACAPRLLLALALSSLLLGACASVPKPTARMAVASAAVEQASTTSISESAPKELQLAKDKLAAAQAAMKAEDYALAGRLADEAKIDADVAVTHAQSATAAKAARDSQDAARVLSEELSRKTSN